MAVNNKPAVKPTDKPYSELVAIMPNTELDEAYENLRLKYGDRLLTVYEGKAKAAK